MVRRTGGEWRLDVTTNEHQAMEKEETPHTKESEREPSIHVQPTHTQHYTYLLAYTIVMKIGS